VVGNAPTDFGGDSEAFSNQQVIGSSAIAGSNFQR
jgi:hypothetical protein